MATRRPPRKYAAYYRTYGTRKWKRKHLEIQGSKDCIVRLYQDWLLIGSRNAEYQIRSVPRKKA